ncbi:MAG TPA: hypothetical protein VE553_04940 [Candidatus Binatia bacterium]|jgi:hypothetical protein|nr:hypothetical protein [Candidatus Binatia bacterium]
MLEPTTAANRQQILDAIFRLQSEGSANAETHRVFVEELTGTLQVIALGAKVQADFNQGASGRLGTVQLR